jgi:hypothetical protein
VAAPAAAAIAFLLRGALELLPWTASAGFTAWLWRRLNCLRRRSRHGHLRGRRDRQTRRALLLPLLEPLLSGLLLP